MLVLNPTLMCAFIIRMHRPTTHPPLMLATEDYRRHEQEKRWCQWAANPWRGAWYRLPSLISEKCGQPYSTTISWIRCVITFSLTDSVIACLRTPKSSLHRQRSLCRSRATQSLSLLVVTLVSSTFPAIIWIFNCQGSNYSTGKNHYLLQH